uniref:Uncharacterized protein n=1 Tax=Anguilla anguilla TaxID=7936 RepID=A0A0E9U9G5_ANGAN
MDHIDFMKLATLHMNFCTFYLLGKTRLSKRTVFLSYSTRPFLKGTAE